MLELNSPIGHPAAVQRIAWWCGGTPIHTHTGFGFRILTEAMEMPNQGRPTSATWCVRTYLIYQHSPRDLAFLLPESQLRSVCFQDWQPVPLSQSDLNEHL